MGDLNARTGLLQEKYYDDFEENHANCNIIEGRNRPALPIRNNKDKKVLGHGNILMEIINSTQLTIVNGRTVGDLEGKFTCDHWNGSSCVDYCNFYNKILSFEVLPSTSYSDHSPISLCIKGNTNLYLNNIDDNEDLEPVIKLTWSDTGNDQFKQHLQEPRNQAKLNHLVNDNAGDSNYVLESFTDILTEAMKGSFKIKILNKFCQSKWESTE